jgi:CDP-6-deoxy-D-xylo-4-hexulose-3-dehydrase
MALHSSSPPNDPFPGNLSAAPAEVEKEEKKEFFATQPAAHYNSRYYKPLWYAPNKFEAYGEEEIQAVIKCLRDGWLAPGPRTLQFEREVAASFGKKDGIFVNSGSSANVLSLKLCSLKAGDEVITPACTFSTTVAPLVQLGLEAVFCDVETIRFVPSIEQCMEKVTAKTRCMFLPNLAGSKPDWAGLRAAITAIGRHEGPDRIWLVEDSCDTMTCTPESDVSVISFYASHVITAGGTGGMAMFNEPHMRDLGLQYRDWGRMGTNSEDPSERFGHQVDGIDYDFKFLYGVIGYNFKGCEMNASFGLIQMQKLSEFLKIRRENVSRFMQNMKDTPFILPDDSPDFDPEPNWLAFPMLVPPEWKRKELLHWIEANGIQTRVFFAGNVCRHPAYKMYADVKDQFPNSDIIMRDCFMLGAHHGLTTDDVDYMCSILKEYYPGIMDKPVEERPNTKFERPKNAREHPECQVVIGDDGVATKRPRIV